MGPIGQLRYRSQLVNIAACAGVVCLLLNGCKPTLGNEAPSIEFSRVPPAGEGDPVAVETIEGRVTGSRPDLRIVLFARSGVWWVQPRTSFPFTTIQADSTWKNSTHPGSAYAALLVDSRYRPPQKVWVLPERGGPVLAVAVAEGGPRRVPLKQLQFSGYKWEIRGTEGTQHVAGNLYDSGNAWTDQSGALHLRIARRGQWWSNAQVELTRSLGYGSYRFVVRDISHLETSAVFALFTWDDLRPSPRNGH